MAEEIEPQTTQGRRQPCCISLAWAVKCGYIKRGYLWRMDSKQAWVPWCFRLSGKGWIETSPIHYCPFCGTDLDEKEE